MTAVAKQRQSMGLIGAVLAGAVLMATNFAVAQGPGGGPDGMGPHRPPMERAMGPHGDHGRWWNDQRSIDKYKLTETQRKGMDDIYQQHRVTLVDLHASLEKAELSMEPLMQADDPDEGKIMAQIDRIAQARAELEKANAKMLFGVRKQLTAEQWKQIRTDRQAHHDADHGPDGDHGMGQRRHPGGPGVGPDGGQAGGGPGGGGPNGPGGEGPGEM